MAQLQIFEGTLEELIGRKEEFAGMKLQVFALPEPATEEPEDWSELLPDPPNTVRDLAHLEALLLEGLNSPQEPVTEQDWIEIRQEVHRRHAARKQQA